MSSLKPIDKILAHAERYVSICRKYHTPNLFLHSLAVGERMGGRVLVSRATNSPIPFGMGEVDNTTLQELSI